MLGRRSERHKPLQENQGFGASLWLQAEKDAGQLLGLVAVKRQDEIGYHDIVIFDSRDGRIQRVNFAREAFAVRLPKSDDWADVGVYLSFKITDSEIKIMRFEHLNGDTWNLTNELPKIGEARNLKPLEGNDFFKRLLNPEDLEARLSAQALETNDVEINLILGMIQRAGNLEKVLRSANLDQAPPDLSTVLEHLLKASITRNQSSAEPLVDPKLPKATLGKIAAAALQPEFRVEGIRFGMPADVILQQKPFQSPNATGSVDSPNIVRVFASYLKFSGELDSANLVFTFSRTSPTEQWRLTDFADEQDASGIRAR